MEPAFVVNEDNFTRLFFDLSFNLFEGDHASTLSISAVLQSALLADRNRYMSSAYMNMSLLGVRATD
jgi:hypothetical protein